MQGRQFGIFGRIKTLEAVLKDEEEKERQEKEMRKTKLRETHGKLSKHETLDERIEYLQANKEKLKKLRLSRMKSNIQTYDIRDSEAYRDVIEIERIMKGQML